MASGGAAVTGEPRGFSRIVGLAAGALLLLFGLWAMTSPRSFFDAMAEFPPYNQHFLQDIGAFQIGLGAVLLLAALAGGADALSTALLGVGIGSGAHLVSHLVGLDLGGKPQTDIPTFILLTVGLVTAGLVRRRATAGRS